MDDRTIDTPDGPQEPIVSVTYTAYIEWGGWQWQADGHDEPTALRRLGDRLAHFNPFDGTSTDWGDPGYQTGTLDDRIPPDMRGRMREVTEQRDEIIPEGD